MGVFQFRCCVVFMILEVLILLGKLQDINEEFIKNEQVLSLIKNSLEFVSWLWQCH